ncbi:TetR/AcrR family transcriptional regulator C-terminal domain-containing protein [Natranaerovirga hydrolytica]|nr:TetR/AcrR family transcriptional regulator C-terminal domain-containing protein [Natranaerovirga hydrolytica]
MNRKSFYYHFKDKYDLVNWIYYTDFVANVEQDLNTNTWDVLEKLCFYFYENRSFYYTILKIETHNPFNDYFIKAIEPLIMTSFADTFSNNDHKDFFNTYFVEALRSTIKYWVLYDSKIPPKDFINLLKSMMTEIAYKIVGI